VDSTGVIYTADQSAKKFRTIGLDGIIRDSAGSGGTSTSGTSGPLSSVVFNRPSAIFGDTANGIIYFTDEWYVWRYFTTGGSVSVIAGRPGQGFTTESGSAGSVSINTPLGMWVGPGGILHFADSLNNRIRKIASGSVTTIAGSGSSPGFSGDNFAATTALLYKPTSVYFNSNGIMFIADSQNSRIRWVDTNSIISTFAGNGGSTYNGDNIPATAASIYLPTDAKGDTAGNIYVAVSGHCLVRRISATTGLISTLVGNGVCTITPPTSATSSSIDAPLNLWIDSMGSLYFNSNAKSIHKTMIITPTSAPSSQPSRQPSRQPSSRPSEQPTSAPSTQPSLCPTSQPSKQPTSLPTSVPSSQPSRRPSSQPSGRPSLQPISRPSSLPSGQPSSFPSGRPSTQPTSDPTGQPTSQPSRVPSNQPTSRPSNQPSSLPSTLPTTQPSLQPVSHPTSQPNSRPSALPSMQPSSRPTGQPSNRPSQQPASLPTTQPTGKPSNQPTIHPTGQPSSRPSSHPSTQPTIRPTDQPSRSPTTHPTTRPSSQPSSRPSPLPSSQPSRKPSSQPSTQPSRQPTSRSTGRPSSQPTSQPTRRPSNQPTDHPSSQPSERPSSQPTHRPSNQPTSLPTAQPSRQPSTQPTGRPSRQPSSLPTTQPTVLPTTQPTHEPSTQPSSQPSSFPSVIPSAQPSVSPSRLPTTQPTRTPSSQPSSRPSTQPLALPTNQPSSVPSTSPSSQPTGLPTDQPSSLPSSQPSLCPSDQPTSFPSTQPTTCPSSIPSSIPSAVPSVLPSSRPSSLPSVIPSCRPTTQPSDVPTCFPSSLPSSQPTSLPSCQPSCFPTSGPTAQPSGAPTSQPLAVPSSQPSSFPSTNPSNQPSSLPTTQPSSFPSSIPSLQPFSRPTALPSNQPTVRPTVQPSNQPTTKPTVQPLSFPTSCPTVQPSSRPSKQPLSRPTGQPTSQPTRVPSAQPFSLPTSAPLATIYQTKGVLFYPGDSIYSSSESLGHNTTFLGTSFIVFGRNAKNNNPRNRFPSVVTLNSADSSGGNPYIAKMKEGNGVGIQSDSTTRSTTILGDINGDGSIDVLVGYPMESKCNIYYGGIVGSEPSFTLIGDPESDGGQLGWSSIRIGDINQDGLEEIMVSAIFANIVFVLYGKRNFDETVLVHQIPKQDGFKIIGSRKDSKFGVALAFLHDFNNDNYPDFAITAVPLIGNQNIIYIVLGSKYFGKDGDISIDELLLKGLSTISCLRIISPVLSSAGYSIAGIGDINGDGFNDLAIGSVPYNNGKYGEQRTYILYGREIKTSNNNNDQKNDLILSEMTPEDGFVIVGGGFLVEGADDMNEDGLADVMVTSFSGWKGHGNAYLINYPKNASYTPTFQPSSMPSSIPSFVPSSAPSIPIFPVPSNFPTSFPSSVLRSPSLLSSDNSTFLPTSVISNNGTTPVAPSFKPSRSPTLRPSRPPTIIPSLRPSLVPTVVPTVVPSVTSTGKPTPLPSQTATLRPVTVSPTPTTADSSSSSTSTSTTTISPSIIQRVQRSAFPSPLPSLGPTVDSSDVATVMELDKPGTFVGEPDKNNQFEIKADSGTVLITGNNAGRGVNVYTIYPSEEELFVFIKDFQSSRDVIDLSHFPSSLAYYSINDLNYYTNPLTFLLGENKKVEVILLSHRDFDLQESNFVFSPSSASGAKQEEQKKVKTTTTTLKDIAAQIVIGIIIMLLLFVCYLGYLEEDRAKKEEEKEMKELEEWEDERSSSDEDSLPSFFTSSSLLSSFKLSDELSSGSFRSRVDQNDEESLLNWFMSSTEGNSQKEYDSIDDGEELEDEENHGLTFLELSGEEEQQQQHLEDAEDMMSDQDNDQIHSFVPQHSNLHNYNYYNHYYDNYNNNNDCNPNKNKNNMDYHTTTNTNSYYQYHYNDQSISFDNHSNYFPSHQFIAVDEYLYPGRMTSIVGEENHKESEEEDEQQQRHALRFSTSFYNYDETLHEME
jgi:hypothetical protein